MADDDGIIHDSAVWDGFFDQRALIERLICVANGGLTQEARLLQDRFPDAKATIHGDLNYPRLIGRYRLQEALDAADKAATEMARQGVAQAAGDPDRRLEHLLRASDELRATFLTMESRLVSGLAYFCRNYALARTVRLCLRLSVMQNRSQCWPVIGRFRC